MEKLKICPFCGKETILCQMQTGYALCIEFSIVCLGCGMEFKVRRNPMGNISQYVYDPGKSAREVIEMFNRRVGKEEPTE